MLARDGVCVFYGSAAGGQTSGGADVSINTGAFHGKGKVRLESLFVFEECQAETATAGLNRLVQLVAARKLTPPISVLAPWADISRVAREFAERHISGKVVLELKST